MPSKTVTVGSSIGLHARPAALIAEAANSVGSAVTIGTVGGAPVDAGSALLIMTLGAKYGDQVVVSSDDQASLDKVATLVEQDLDA
ncbi:MAG: HPr family phosphocarrier protein [Actinomycetota bacterium]|nr:HPr family phosphocarrier protein [Actinomycetota bacterium]